MMVPPCTKEQEIWLGAIHAQQEDVMNTNQRHNILATTPATCRLQLHVRGIILCAAFCLAAYLPSEGTQGPTTCIPPVVGVPGFNNPRPNWFDNTTQPASDFQPDWDTLLKQFHDPRWRGAVSHDFGASTSESEFRGLFNQEGNTTYLYLSWYVKFAPSIDPSYTSLYVGFMPTQGSTTGTILQFTVNTAGDTQDQPSQANNVQYYATTVWTGNGTPTGWSTASIPAWATTDTRVWIKGSSAPNQWAFELRIPIDPNGTTGVNLGTADFLMWHEMQITTPPFQCQGGPNHGQSCQSDADCPQSTCGSAKGLIFYTWPRIDPNNPSPYLYQQVQNGAQLTNTFPDLSLWGDFKLSNDPSSDSSCLNGIYLADDQIGTTNGMWGNEISLSATNHFFAKPYNYSSTAVSSGKITANFYLADWGSQGIGTLLKGQCQGGANNANACTTNTDCPGGACVGASWMPIPPGSNVADPNGIAGYDKNTNTPGQGSIPVDWTLSSSDKCTFIGRTGTTDYLGRPVPGDASCPNLDPILDLDTCLMVKLNGPGLDFNRDSAWTNLEVVAASNFARNATIRVLPGMPKAYMFVEMQNMPSVIDQAWNSIFEKFFGPPQQRTEDHMREVVARMTPVERKQTLPTYIVHTYYDTGKTVMLKGVQNPILLPQIAFGYYVIPHASVLGWTNKLEGATTIAPNAYQIAMPSNGIAHVRTSITAVETGGGGFPWCDHGTSGGAFALLGGMFVLGLMVYLPRKK
jgi:hypothetical protein